MGPLRAGGVSRSKGSRGLQRGVSLRTGKGWRRRGDGTIAPAFALKRMMSGSFKLRSLQAACYRYPLTTPIVTSFGRMNDRPAVFVRVEDEDGAHGVGEVWCNFPAIGAEHRARLINEVLGPMLSGRAIAHPAEVFDYLCAATSVLALQAGEQGPFAQAIAGVDIALWD